MPRHTPIQFPTLRFFENAIVGRSECRRLRDILGGDKFDVLMQRKYRLYKATCQRAQEAVQNTFSVE